MMNQMNESNLVKSNEVVIEVFHSANAQVDIALDADSDDVHVIVRKLDGSQPKQSLYKEHAKVHENLNEVMDSIVAQELLVNIDEMILKMG